jgi:GTPase SAR1 family protein
VANGQRNRLEVACDNAGWTHSRRLRCLGFEWSTLTNDPALDDCITSLYEACIDGRSGPAPHVFILRRHASSESVSLYRDGHAILRRAPDGLAIAQLVWAVNRGVVEEAGNRLLLHAAAAERDGRIVLLAGPEGSGKSTLVTALVCSGFTYLTDETVAIEMPAGTIAPYPKPIALHDDALGSLRALGAGLPEAVVSGGGERLVPAQGIRSDAVAQSGRHARVLVLLSASRPGRAVAARSIPRAEAAIALAEQAFNFRELGPGRMNVLADAVRACDCYRLDVGDIDTARRLVLDLFDTAVTFP